MVPCKCQNMAAPTSRHALSLKILAECSTTKARACDMTLPHHVVQTPVFMPVGTQGTLKGMTPDQLKELDCRIMLGNTYHLGHRPVSLFKMHDSLKLSPSLCTSGMDVASLISLFSSRDSHSA